MTIVHEVAGAGPVVVLLHSGVADRRMWDPQWPELLAAGYQLVRGHRPGPALRAFGAREDALLEAGDLAGGGGRGARAGRGGDRAVRGPAP